MELDSIKTSVTNMVELTKLEWLKISLFPRGVYIRARFRLEPKKNGYINEANNSLRSRRSFFRQERITNFCAGRTRR